MDSIIVWIFGRMFSIIYRMPAYNLFVLFLNKSYSCWLTIDTTDVTGDSIKKAGQNIPHRTLHEIKIGQSIVTSRNWERRSWSLSLSVRFPVFPLSVGNFIVFNRFGSPSPTKLCERNRELHRLPRVLRPSLATTVDIKE
jgi:hypothetical protein